MKPMKPYGTNTCALGFMNRWVVYVVSLIHSLSMSNLRKGPPNTTTHGGRPFWTPKLFFYFQGHLSFRSIHVEMLLFFWTEQKHEKTRGPDRALYIQSYLLRFGVWVCREDRLDEI